MTNELNTRGRKREARRWIAEDDRRCYAAVFGDGTAGGGIDRFGRTFTRRSDESTRASTRRTARLRARDPALHAAVMEILWADAKKQWALSLDERIKQRAARVQRDRDRARRQALSK